MNRWWGSAADSAKQAGERASRAARRTIASQQQQLGSVNSDSDDNALYKDANTSGLLNVDGNDDQLSDDGAANSSGSSNSNNMPATPFDQEDKENDAESWKKELKVKFDRHDVNYWFNQSESDMKKYGINQQWDKKNAIVTVLPADVIEELKPLLRLTEAEAGTTIYKSVKDEILSIFGPRDEDAFRKAMALCMTGRPSALGKQLLHVICPGAKPMDGCHCAKMIYGFWEAQLTPVLKTKIAGLRFNKDTYQNIFKQADEAWLANGGSMTAPTVVAAVSTPQSPPSPSEFQDSQVNPSQIAALQRGGGRGGRGNRNFRGGRGGQRGGRYNNNQGQRQAQPNQQSGPKPHQKGPKASPDVPASACARHWKEGKNATYCSDPLVCEWVNFVKPRPSSSS